VSVGEGDGGDEIPSERVTPVVLYAFGGSPEHNSAPRPPRPLIEARGDMAVEGDATVLRQSPPLPQGASLFADPGRAPLNGHCYRIDAGTLLPEGLGVVADGRDVVALSPHDPTHHTLYPTRRMPFEEFVRLYLELPWEYAGRKRR
jgi:hypothetical protein